MANLSYVISRHQFLIPKIQVIMTPDILSAVRTGCLIRSRDYKSNSHYFVFQTHVIQEKTPNTHCLCMANYFCELFFLFDQKLSKGRDCHHHHLCIPYSTRLKDGRHSVNSRLKHHFLKTQGPKLCSARKFKHTFF